MNSPEPIKRYGGQERNYLQNKAKKEGVMHKEKEYGPRAGCMCMEGTLSFIPEIYICVICKWGLNGRDGKRIERQKKYIGASSSFLKAITI